MKGESEDEEEGPTLVTVDDGKGGIKHIKVNICVNMDDAGKKSINICVIVDDGKGGIKHIKVNIKIIFEIGVFNKSILGGPLRRFV